MNVFSKLTIKNLKQNKIRTFITIIGVILSTAMFTAVTTILSSIQTYLKESVIEQEGSWQMAYGALTSNEVQTIIEKKQIQTAATVQIQGYAKRNEEPFQKSYFCFAGFSKEAYEILNPKLIGGRFPQQEGEIAIPYEMLLYDDNAQEYNIGQTASFSIGKRIDGEKLLGQLDYYSKTEELIDTTKQTFTIVGIYESLGAETFNTVGYTMITIPKQNSQMPQDLYLTVNQPKNIFSFADTISLEKEPIFHTILLRYQGVVDNSRFYHVIEGLAFLIFILITGGSVILIYNAFSISVSERTKQFGLLTSIGATKRQLHKMIRVEATIVGMIGIPLGILSGIIGIGITLKFIGNGLVQLVGTSKHGMGLSISWISILTSVLLSSFTIFISAWIPAIRSGKISPMEVIRQTKDIRIPKKMVKTSKGLYNLFGFKWVLSLKNYRRSKKKYKSIIISLVLSMVLFISASSFVSYLNNSSSFVLQDAISEGDIYFNSYNEEISYSRLKECLNKILQDSIVEDGKIIQRAILDVDVPFELLEDSEQAIQEPTTTIFLYIMENQDFEAFMQSQNLDPKPYLTANQNRGVLFDQKKYIKNGRYQQRKILNSHTNLALSFTDTFAKQELPKLIQFQAIENIHTTQDILLSDVVSTLPLGVVGSDSLIILLPKVQFERFLKPYKFSEYSIHTRLVFQAKDHIKAYEEIQRYLLENGIINGKYGNLYNIAQETQGDRSTLMAVRVLSYGFIILITLIAIVNVFHTISTNISLRKREFAMLHSVGMTSKDLKQVTRYECLFCIGRSILYGIPLSILMDYLIYHAISIGVEIKMLLPILPTLIAIIGITFIIFFTMWYSVGKLNKENTIDVLKNENI